MRYPNHYVGNYGNLAAFLSDNGFAVYSMEMNSFSIIHEANALVDVVALKGNSIYAFEYKSTNDSVKRAIKQVENYRKCFDFVTVVAESFRDLSNYLPTFRKLGVGAWHIFSEKGKWVVRILEEPQRQEPTKAEKAWLYGRCYSHCASWRDITYLRFLRNMGLAKERKTETEHDLRQRSLNDYVT